MTASERRTERPPDRRRTPRGGRRDGDAPGLHPTVLVVDADAGVRRTCAQFLTRRGFLVDEAGGGVEASAAILMTRPHVALVDPVLPAGRTFLPSARDAGIPIVIMTTDFLEYPPDTPGVLVKPFPLEEMLIQLRRVLTVDDATAPARG